MNALEWLELHERGFDPAMQAAYDQAAKEGRLATFLQQLLDDGYQPTPPQKMMPISQLPGLTDAQRRELIALAGDFRSTGGTFERLRRTALRMVERDRLIAAGGEPKTLPPRWADIPVAKRLA